VRFGNVLGSNGSVVPLFREQIAAGGPLTLTDERMTRYFMSIHEAAELIVQAGTLSQGRRPVPARHGRAGEDPRSCREHDPARRPDGALAGQNPDGDIAIEVTGIRPGEKLYEELFYDPAHAGDSAREDHARPPWAPSRRRSRRLPRLPAHRPRQRRRARTAPHPVHVIAD
jgi:FlaA1/EpsC-like NDP-sugar epimerase